MNELRNQQDFAACWEGDAEVVVPRAIEAYSTPRVLVTEFVHAREWAEMLATADEASKSKYGRVIFRFVFQSLFCYGMFNGDPHPGNYMFYPDGRVAFIDYGCVQRYSPEQTTDFQALRSAVLADARGPEFRALLSRVFGLPEDIDADMMDVLEDYMHLSFEPVTAPQPFRFDEGYVRKHTELGVFRG